MKLSDTPSYTQNAQISPIRKELLILTKDHNHAIVLNQLLYWTKRLKDFDLLVKEEQRADSPLDDAPRQHGWFYKSAQELLEETLLSVSKVTLRKYINILVAKGWVSERLNPRNKWKKTMQYRVNLRKVQADLKDLGWRLSGFPEDLFCPSLEGNNNESPKPNREKSKDSPKVECEGTKDGKPQKSASSENDPSKERNAHFDVQETDTSKCEKLSLLYLNKTTLKTTNKEHITPREQEEPQNPIPEDGERPQGVCSPFDKNCFKKESIPVAETMVQLWKKHVGQEVLLLTKRRSSLLRSALKLLFNDDLTGWEAMCLQVKDSPFLMGKGDKGWHITLDWLLREDNLVKVLEGNFDSPETLEKKRKDAYTQVETTKKWDLLNMIQDPIWKDWCTKLSFPSSSHKVGIAACELEDLLCARFREFDGRIVIVESETQRCHERIEKLWMELGAIARQTYPTSRRVSSELITPLPSAQTTHPQNFTIGENHA